jgi:hypothetical protein
VATLGHEERKKSGAVAAVFETRNRRPRILERIVGDRGILARDKKLGRAARKIVMTALEAARGLRSQLDSRKRLLRRLAAQDPLTSTRIFDDDEARQIGGGIYRRGLKLVAGGNLARGERCFRRAAERWPSVGWFSYRLGSLLLTQGRDEEAGRIFAAGVPMRLTPDLVTDPRILLVGPKHYAALHGALREPGASVIDGDPSRNLAAILLFLSCDSTYFRLYGSAAVASALANSGVDLACHVHIVNPDSAAVDEQTRIRRRHPDRAVSFSNESTNLSSRSEAERRVYYACRRFQLLPAILRQAARPVIVADVDQLVVRGLAPILTAVSESDIGLIEFEQRTYASPLATISASAVVAQGTDGARRYFDLVAAYVDYCFERNLWVWHLDQAALYAAKLMVEAWGEPVRIRPLDPAILESVVFDAAATGEPAPGTVFWSITHSLSSNAAKRRLDLFERYSSR